MNIFETIFLKTFPIFFVVFSRKISLASETTVMLDKEKFLFILLLYSRLDFIVLEKNDYALDFLMQS